MIDVRTVPFFLAGRYRTARIERRIHGSKASADRYALSFIEVLVLVALLTALIVELPDRMSALFFRAQVTEALASASGLKAAIVEHYALRGDWEISEGDLSFDPSLGRLQSRSDSSQSPAASDASDRTPDKSASGAISGVAYAIAMIFPGDTSRSAGNRQASGEESFLFLRPAVREKVSDQQIVIWSCGDDTLPPGWSGPAPVVGMNQAQTYSVICRRPTSP